CWLVLAATWAACASYSSEQETLFDEYVTMLEEAPALMAEVSSAASARSVAPRLDALQGRMAEARGRLLELPEPARNALARKYRDRVAASEGAYHEQISRALSEPQEDIRQTLLTFMIEFNM